MDLNANGGATTWRTLRAFTWMRWRTLVNALDRTGSRDIIERFSLAVEQVAPLLAMAMLVPSALALAALAGYAGYWLSGTAPVVTFQVVRFLLLIGSGFCLVGPLVMPAMERTSAVRLLLLPIRRGTLYAAQAGSALSDPWVILALPLVLGLPVGLVLGGAPAAALVALAAGLLLGTVLIGLSAFASFLLNLIVRDRRRAELAALLFVLVPALLMLPGLLNSGGSRDERHAERAAAAERRARGETTFTDRAWNTGRAALRFLPSELYTTAVRSASSGDLSRSAMPLAGLMTFALVVHGLGLAVFSRLLEVPSGGTRQKASRRQRQVDLASSRPVPHEQRRGDRPAAARAAYDAGEIDHAVAAPRVPDDDVRGVAQHRSIRCRRDDDCRRLRPGGVRLDDLPAVDPAVLDESIRRRSGRADSRHAGAGLAAGAPDRQGRRHGRHRVPAGDDLHPDGGTLTSGTGRSALWLCLPTAMIATIAMGSPGAAALSALFPRSVDLNSIGRGSNAHGLAALLGLVLYVVSALPALFIVLLCTAILDRPTLAPFLMVLWCAAALVLARSS